MKHLEHENTKDPRIEHLQQYPRLKVDSNFVVSDPSMFLALCRKHEEEYIVELPDGLGDVFVHPDVLSPLYSRSGRFTAALADFSIGQKVCDVGTGSGIVGMLAARRGVERVVAFDINPHAVRAARNTALLNGQEDVMEVVQAGSLDELADTGFDRIVMNCPWWDCDPPAEIANSPLRWAMYDPGYRSTGTLLAQARAHLNEGGTFLLCFSTQGNTRLIEHIFEKTGYTIKQKKTREHGHTRVLYYLSIA